MIVLEWLFRAWVIAIGCWWIFLAVVVSIDCLRPAGDRWIRGAVVMTIAKGVPGALFVAFGLTFKPAFFYLALVVSIAAAIVRWILERVGLQLDFEESTRS